MAEHPKLKTYELPLKDGIDVADVEGALFNDFKAKTSRLYGFDASVDAQKRVVTLKEFPSPNVKSNIESAAASFHKFIEGTVNNVTE